MLFNTTSDYVEYIKGKTWVFLSHKKRVLKHFITTFENNAIKKYLLIKIWMDWKITEELT